MNGDVVHDGNIEEMPLDQFVDALKKLINALGQEKNDYPVEETADQEHVHILVELEHHLSCKYFDSLGADHQELWLCHILPCIKALLYRSYHTDELLCQVQTCVATFMRLFLHLISQDSLALAECLLLIFDPQQILYKEHEGDHLPYGEEQQEPLSEEEVSASRDERRTWKAFEWLDFYDRRSKVWVPAQIQSVFHEKGADGSHFIRVSPWNNALRRLSDNVDLPLYEAPELAPYKSKQCVSLAKWRQELKVGSALDARDNVRKWYTASVVSVDEELLMVSFDGWSDRYNESIERSSDRLAPLTIYARGGREDGGVVLTDDERLSFEDVDDPTDAIAVFRSRHVGSGLLVDNLIRFHGLGGFDALLKRLKHHEPNVGVSLLVCYTSLVYVPSHSFTHSFLLTLAPELQHAAFDCVLTYSNDELRALKKEDLDRLVHGVNGLLRRVMCRKEHFKRMEEFTLAASLRRLRCDMIERRINGLTAIHDLLAASTGHPPYGVKRVEFLTTKMMLEWLDDEHVLEYIFGKESHPQLMKRSSELLKFICSEGSLSLEQLGLVWDAIEHSIKYQDHDQLDILHKVLDDVARTLKQHHFEFLYEKLKSIPYEDYREPTLELCQELSRYSVGKVDFLNLLWDVLQNVPVEDSLIGKARAVLCSALESFQNRHRRLGFMEKCIDNITSSRVVSQSVGLLEDIINLYSTVSSAYSPDTRMSIISQLDEKSQLFQAVFRDFQHVQQTQQEVSQSQFVKSISRRLSFLYFLLSHSEKSLTTDQVDILWDTMIDGASEEESGLALDWFCKCLGTHEHPTQRVLSLPLVEHLFSRILHITNYSSFSTSLFGLFQRCFMFINSRNGCVEFISESEDFWVQDFENLHGVPELWRVALECDSVAVSRSASLFLNEVHHRLGADMLSDTGVVRKDFVDKCMAVFSKRVAAKDNTSVKRVLLLLESFLDATDNLRGVGSLRSHGSLMKGAAWELNMQNNIPYSRYERKFKLESFENETLWAFRSQVAEMLGESAENVRLFTNGAELKNSGNSRLLRQLNIKNGSNVLVSRVARNEAKVELLDESQELTPRFKEVLHLLFNEFASQEDEMQVADMQSYFQICGTPSTSSSEQRVRSIFSRFGQSTQSMSFDGFCRFYQDACFMRLHAVWGDVKCFGYRGDLRLQADVQDSEDSAKDETLLPRYLLSTTPEHFDALFQACDAPLDNQVKIQVWQLLCNLPSNPTVEETLLKSAWSGDSECEVLDASQPFRLLYSLYLLESFVDSGRSWRPGNEAWQKEFVTTGGVKVLMSVFDKLCSLCGVDVNSTAVADAATSTPVDIRNRSLSLLLQMLQSVVLGAVSAVRPIKVLPEEPLTAESKGSDESVNVTPSPALSQYDEEKTSVDREEKEASPVVEGEESHRVNGGGEHEAGEAHYDGPGTGTDLILVGEAGAEGDKEEVKPEKDNEIKPEQEQSHVAFSRLLGVECAEQILGTVDMATFVRRLWRVINYVALHRPVLNYDFKSVTSATDVLLAIVEHDTSLLQQIFQELKHNPQLLLSILLAHASTSQGLSSQNMITGKRISKTIVLHIRDLSHVTKETHHFFLTLLLDHLPSPSRTTTVQASETDDFFTLLSILIKEHLSKFDGKVEEFAELFGNLLQQLLQHSGEKERCVKPEKSLLGLLRLLHTLVEKSSREFIVAHVTPSLVTTLFTRFLFSSSKASPKCQHKNTRFHCFQLLSQLAERCEEFNVQVLRMIDDHQGRVDPPLCFDYNPSRMVRADTGFVGLKNLATTCYMNALLQQLYMTPEFRYSILAAPTSGREVSSRKDDILYQVQVMFANLLFSERQAYDTTPFCYAYKDDQGNPINVRIQQDAHEFFTVFMDRLEMQLKDTPQQHILQQLFGGTFANQMICTGGCDTIRESSEAFLTLTLCPMADIHDLDSGLERLVRPELLSGVNCDACQTKVDTHRRVVLNELPNVMIVHFKRFELNFESFQTEKVNSRCEFAAEFNFEPFTKEGIQRLEMEKRKQAGEEVEVPQVYSTHPKEHYEYSLKGVLVHTGTLDGGHYYSFIRDREHDNGGWFEFNDSFVGTWNVNTLEEQCFGGEFKDKTQWGYFTTSERMNNAYMLIYERTRPYVADTAPDQEEDVSESSESSVSCIVSRAEDLPSNMEIISSVKKTNETFRQHLLTFSPQYSSFVLKCFKQFYESSVYTPCMDFHAADSDNPSLSIVQQALKFTLTIVGRSANNTDTLAEFVKVSSSLLLDNLPACVWLLRWLARDKDMLTDFSLRCRTPTVLQQFSSLVNHVLSMVLPFEEEAVAAYHQEYAHCLYADLEGEDDERCPETPQLASGAGAAIKPSCLELVDELLELLDVAARQWMRFSSYFGMLLHVAKESTFFAQYLVRRKLIAWLGDFLLGERSPIKEHIPRGYHPSHRMVQPNWGVIVELMSVLVMQCAVTKSHQDHDHLLDLATLSPLSLQILECDEFFSEALLHHEHDTAAPMAVIMKHLAYRHKPYSSRFIHIIIDGVERSNFDGVSAYLTCADALLRVGDGDEAIAWRMATMFSDKKGILYLMKYYLKRYADFTYVACRYVIRMAEEIPPFHEFMKENRGQWMWMDRFLRSYIGHTKPYSNLPVPTAMQKERQRTSKRQLDLLESMGLQANLDPPSAHVGTGSDVHRRTSSDDIYPSSTRITAGWSANDLYRNTSDTNATTPVSTTATAVGVNVASDDESGFVSPGQSASPSPPSSLTADRVSPDDLGVVLDHVEGVAVVVSDNEGEMPSLVSLSVHEQGEGRVQ